MSIKMIEPLTQINGYAVRPGMYGAVLLPSDEMLEQAVASLRWTTSEQDEYNTWRHNEVSTCSTCKGRGYTRKQPNVGCAPCKGVGYVPR